MALRTRSRRSRSSKYEKSLEIFSWLLNEASREIIPYEILMPSITFFLIDSQRTRVYSSKEKVKNFKNKSFKNKGIPLKTGDHCQSSQKL